MTQRLPAPGDDKPAIPPADPGWTSAGAGTTPAVIAVTVLGTLLTGLFLVTADRWESSATSRFLVIVALVTALVAVLAAVTGQVLATAPVSTATMPARRVRRGVAVVVLAAALSGVAVLSAGAAALVTPRGGGEATGTEPTVTVRVAGGPAARTVSAVVSFPEVAAGEVVDANLVGVSADVNEDGVATTNRTLLARTTVRAGGHGPVAAEMAAVLASDSGDVTLTATAGKQTCTAGFSVLDPASVPVLTCRD